MIVNASVNFYVNAAVHAAQCINKTVSDARRGVGLNSLILIMRLQVVPVILIKDLSVLLLIM